MAPVVMALAASGVAHATAVPLDVDERNPIAHREPRAKTPRPIGRPLWAGSMDIGVGFGFDPDEKAGFRASASWDYNVIGGLAPGLETVFAFGVDTPTTVSLLPCLRWAPFRSYTLTSLVGVRGGRRFVISAPDSFVVGAGGGLAIFYRRRVAFTLEAYVDWLPGAPSEQRSWLASIVLSLRFSVGGRRATRLKIREPQWAR